VREDAVLAAQRRQVGDGGEGDEVEVPEQRIAVAAQRSDQRLTQLERDARAGQPLVRVAAVRRGSG
jgi:hypothetical protein